MAEDVVQDVYVKVLGGKAQYDGRADFKTWLFAVIRLTAADERRRCIFRRLALRLYKPPAAIAEPLDLTAYRSELQLIFRRSLADLPRRQREILQLVFYHDMSLSEAADVMGISLGSARTHYDRRQKAIRQRVKETGDATRTRPAPIPGYVL